jgi:hypothetical protein
MSKIDWSLVKLQYELFGQSVDQLAEEYGIAPNVLRYAADERGWQRNELALTTRTLPSTSSKLDLAESITENQKLLRAIKLATLSPKYIALEAALLGKCISFLSNLADDDPTNAAALKAVADILKSLTDTNQPKVADQNNGGGGLTVNIQNNFDTDDSPTNPNHESVTVTIDPDPSSAERSALEG